MADYEQIMKALRAADAAGDDKAAARLAQMAREAKGAATERTLGQRLYDNIIGDPDDGVQSTGEALGTWLNRAGESATLGVVGDEASAAATGILPGRSYESELERYRQNEEKMSVAGRLSADLAGALVPGAGAVGAVGKATSIGGKVVRGAGAGAATGGLYGFMEGEGDDRLVEARDTGLLGGLLGGLIPVAGSAVRGVAERSAARKAVKDAAKGAPSSEALRAQGNALYQQIDDAGVQIKPEAFDRMRGGLLDRLRTNTGYDELPGAGSLTPNTARIVNIMDDAAAEMAAEPTAALPFRSLDQMRRQAGAAAGNVTSKADQKAGVEVIKQIDEFVQSLGPDDVVGGDVAALKSAIGKARDVWSRMSKSQMVDDAIEAGDDYLSGSASGIRNQFKNILRNKKLSKGFTAAEKAALREVTHGSMLDQMINLAGGGLGQLMSVGGGLAGGGPMGGLLGAAAAAGQRKLAESVVTRNAETARAAMASGLLRSPEVMNRIAISGRQPETIANTGLFGLLGLAERQ